MLQALLNADVMLTVLGTTVIGDCVEVVELTTVKFAFCTWPDVTSVARITAGCVGAFGCACTATVATPCTSVITEMVWTCGVAGLLLRNAIGPDTTSNLICRPTEWCSRGPW